MINDTLHHDLNVSCIKDEIKRFSQRYTDTMDQHANIITTNLTKEVKTIRRLKENYFKTRVTDRIVIYRAYAFGFFKTSINY